VNMSVDIDYTMGLLLGKAMDENFKKNQEFMLASQRIQVCCHR